MNICLKFILYDLSNNLINMLDCNNNTQIFEDNHGIFELIESYNYSLSNDK